MQDLKLPRMAVASSSLLILIFCFSFHGHHAQRAAVITSKSPIKDPAAITSPTNVFKLGFYSPENSRDRYLAVYYVVSEVTAAWIANRDRPLKDSSGTATISEDGNLVLIDGKNDTIWSTNVTNAGNATTTAATLRDNGNLVLYDDSTGLILWESFLHPSNVQLPDEFGLIDDTNTGERVVLSSWKNDSNPGRGEFTLGLQALKIPQVFVWKEGKPHFRSGPWNGLIFLGMTVMSRTIYRNGARLTESPNGVFNLSISPEAVLLRGTLTSFGALERSMWNDRRKSWDILWDQPENDCDVYGKCGPFGTCDAQNSPAICSCLKGFEPADEGEWARGNWSSGCVRRKPLSKYCRSNSIGRNDDGFLRMPFMKVPDFAERFPSQQIDECRRMCLSNCSCIAYAYDSYIGCLFWREGDGLIDTQQFTIYGVDLYIRLANSEIGDEKSRRKLYIIITATVGAFLMLIFVGWCCKFHRKGRRRRYRKGSKSSVRSALDSKELPFFSVGTLKKATNKFHEDNLIGKGGFGHVYKGKLPKGKEIAVKRLSETSDQGTEEFMNEVVVISKLQHKNLVRLLGCCVEKDERMLIYEYMPNKSLDVCLFDTAHPSMVILDWKRRFNIIEGIGRGLVYLHRDSRMRIIHRDLKPSNVLLDKEWNPKISDFGMARIFGDNQEQGNTARVVGTHGYMAPEYALEGIFSEKSDIYSFGVLMLEIVSGKKSTRYYNSDLSLNLIGCSWKSWSEDNCMQAFADRNIASSSSDCGEEIGRCIHVGLLCVQEFVEDRPTTQTVVSMLNREILDLPVPKQPSLAKKMDSTQPNNGWSANQLTVTVLDGR